jgi:hypothetical protein
LSRNWSRSVAWLRLQQNDAASVTAPDNLGLKQKFSFSYFCENLGKIFFRFLRKKLTKSCENFCFCVNFSLGMRIRIQEPTECVSSTKTLVDGTQKSIENILFLAEGFENKMIAKTWAKKKIFATTFRKTKTFFYIFRENKTFRENHPGPKNFKNERIFAYFCLKKRGFCFNPMQTLFINMLKLHKITISENRVAEP